MSIIKSIERAYSLLQERSWDTIYWAIDLHGTCIKSDYVSGKYEWINEDAKNCMQLLNNLRDVNHDIIIWSSIYQEESEKVFRWMESEGIGNLIDFNNNGCEMNTRTGCFNKKFYFSVLLDDKAGFDPDTDWKLIYEYLKSKNGLETTI